MKTKTENDEMHVMDVYHFFFCCLGHELRFLKIGKSP